MMLTDINHWIIAYTDLSGTALEMVIKWQIALMTAISEAIIKDVTKTKIGKSNKFCERCNKMVVMKMITESLKDELHWLWNIRANIHIGEIDGSEYQKYEMKVYIRAKKVVYTLGEELRNQNAPEPLC